MKMLHACSFHRAISDPVQINPPELKIEYFYHAGDLSNFMPQVEKRY